MAAQMMTQEETVAAYASALERKKRDRANVYRSVTEEERRRAWLENREVETGPGLYSPQFREAENLGEWLDDLVLMWNQMRGCPEQPLIVTLAEAARRSLPEAVKVLKAARDLPPAAQFTVYENLRAWRSRDVHGRMLGEQLAAALLQEWGRLKLPTEDPAVKPQPKRRRRSWEVTETEATA